LNTIEWLENTPAVDQPQKRKEANTFLLKWTEGCPYITIELGKVLVPLLKNNSSQNIIIFFAGWIKYALTSKDYNNQIEGNNSGIEAVINFYSKNKKWIDKDKGVENYIKMQKKGTLKKYIEKIVTKESENKK
jgi:hypothetical protein